MTRYKCVFCDIITPEGAHYCATCNRIDGCNPLKTFIVEETHRHTVEALDEDEAMQMVNDGTADCPAIAITRVEQVERHFTVNYSATYFVEADSEDEAIQIAIELHGEMPDGDWSAEEGNTDGFELGSSCGESGVFGATFPRSAEKSAQIGEE